MFPVFEIIMFVCLSATPDRCEERALTVEFPTQAACTTKAQPLLAQWLSQHPKYDLKKWSCAVVGSRGQEI